MIGEVVMENLFTMDDLADVFSQLEQIEDTVKETDDETIASQRRYDEIIKKHKD